MLEATDRWISGHTGYNVRRIVLEQTAGRLKKDLPFNSHCCEIHTTVH